MAEQVENTGLTEDRRKANKMFQVHQICTECIIRCDKVLAGIIFLLSMACLRIRLRNTTRHFGMPIKTYCTIFCVLTAASGAFVMYFLPAIPRYILMTVHVAVGGLGLVSVVTGKPILTDYYKIVMPLSIIPVVVVLGFITYLMGIYDSGTCNHGSYICWLYDMNLPFLISGECGAIFFDLMCAFALMGFIKLRWFQQGITRLRYPEDPPDVQHIRTVIQTEQQAPMTTSLPVQVVDGTATSAPYPDIGENIFPFTEASTVKEKK